MSYKKGDRIEVINDSILRCMGIEIATGEVFTVTPDGRRVIGFTCDQTGCIEGIDDGQVKVK
jgi:hypothetical protein